jgi:hypothetical protein
MIIACESSTQYLSPPAKTSLPALHVEGRDIKNDSGQKLVFKGVNLIGAGEMFFYFLDSWNMTYFDKAASWNAQVLRIPIHYPAYKWYQKNRPGEFFNHLEEGIEWAARNGMYTILDFHSCGWPSTGEYFGDAYDETWQSNIYAFTPAELEQFWHDFAERYASDNRIAFFDLFNEPAKENPSTGGVGDDVSLAAWLEWREYAEKLIDLIRAHDPARLVLVGGLEFSYYINWANKYPVQRDNVVYSVHIYPEKNWQHSWDEAFGDVSQKIPILVGEVGFKQDDTNFDALKASYGIPLMDYLESKQIGWLAWVFGSEWGFKLIEDRTFAPTRVGEFFKSRM